MKRIILITGATDGIGKATAIHLAGAAHEIIVHSRSEEKGKKTIDEIYKKTGNSALHFVAADFTKIADVAKMGEELKQNFENIDVLINNAGVFRVEKNILSNGLEETFMVNHLAHFYLTIELLTLLNKSPDARIINVSSMIHATDIDFDNLQGEKWYDGNDAYSRSKLCNILFTYKLASHLNNWGNISANAVHPGVINTKLLNAGWGPMGEDTKLAAERFAYLAVNEEVKGISGKYFMNNRQTRSTTISYDRTIQNKIWDISSEMVKKTEIK